MHRFINNFFCTWRNSVEGLCLPVGDFTFFFLVSYVLLVSFYLSELNLEFLLVGLGENRLKACACRSGTWCVPLAFYVRFVFFFFFSITFGALALFFDAETRSRCCCWDKNLNKRSPAYVPKVFLRSSVLNLKTRSGTNCDNKRNCYFVPIAFAFKAWKSGLKPFRNICFAFWAFVILKSKYSRLISGNRLGRSGIMVSTKSTAVVICKTSLITSWFSWKIRCNAKLRKNKFVRETNLHEGIYDCKAMLILGNSVAAIVPPHFCKTGISAFTTMPSTLVAFFCSTYKRPWGWIWQAQKYNIKQITKDFKVRSSFWFIGSRSHLVRGFCKQSFLDTTNVWAVISVGFSHNLWNPRSLSSHEIRRL